MLHQAAGFKEWGCVCCEELVGGGGWEVCVFECVRLSGQDLGYAVPPLAHTSRSPSNRAEFIRIKASA